MSILNLIQSVVSFGSVRSLPNSALDLNSKVGPSDSVSRPTTGFTRSAELQEAPCREDHGNLIQQLLGNFEPALGLPAQPGASFPEASRPGSSVSQTNQVGGAGEKAQIGQLIEAAARKYGVPVDIAKAVAWKESNWNSKASSFDGGHGKGVMQIDDRFHPLARTEKVWDPATNIDYGVQLLAKNFKRYGNWHDAIKHYNGSNAVAEKYAHKVKQLAQQKPWEK